MDLVEAVLRGCESEDNFGSFKSNRIEYYDLKLLIKEDLIYLGITDESIQTNIIRNCQNLHSLRSKKQFLIDGQYICLIVNQISLQLRKHFANLSCTVKQQNIKFCDIQLKPVSFCFQKSVALLDENINCLEQMVTRSQKQKHFSMGYKSLMAGVLASLFATYLFFKK